ncbi:LacI family DNA-binding transcriptional regulator [Homoserinimonas sp. A447]
MSPNARATPRVRLVDVAEAAGVATSTASRVFSNPERVSRETVEIVRRVADELGYRPNAITRMPVLAGKSIDLMVQDISNPFFAGVIQGVERQARSAGYSVMLGITDESADIERLHINRVMGSVSGFIVAARGLSDGDLLDLSRRRPVVSFNREVDGVTSVVLETEHGSRQIIEHLASLGHKRVVYVGGPKLSWSEPRRWKGISETAELHGISVERIGPFMPTIDQGAAAAETALSRNPTAIIGYNDQLAIGLIKRLRHLGIDIPGRISVVGYDDTFGADFCQPALTTVASPIVQAGRLSTDVLLTLIDGAPAGRQHNLQGLLHVRESTAVAAAH